jgi:hypothetical protein
LPASIQRQAPGLSRDPADADSGRPAAASTPAVASTPAAAADALRPAPAAGPAALPRRAPDFAAVRADIAAQAEADALIDAEEALAELQDRLRDLRAMRPATAELLFGGDAAWRQALARVGVAAGRQAGQVEALRVRCARSPAFLLDEIARPLAAGTRLQWTGD